MGAVLRGGLTAGSRQETILGGVHGRTALLRLSVPAPAAESLQERWRDAKRAGFDVLWNCDTVMPGLRAGTITPEARGGRGAARGRLLAGDRPGDQPVAATMAIDTRIPGRSTPSLLTQRGGRTSGKNSSKTSTTPSASSGRRSKVWTMTASLSSAPPARRIAWQLSSDWRVCSWIVGPASSPVLTSTPVVPAT